jgi:transketolase
MTTKNNGIQSLDVLREQARIIRRDVILMVNFARSGHPGGPLSSADYLTVLWFKYLRCDPRDPFWKRRDRFVLSNGHCSALNYALLARRGFFNPGYLLTFRTLQSRLVGHPSREKLSFIEVSTGSLGQGLSVAHGMALGARLHGWDEVTIYCNCGDGELQEGACWEAITSAGHRKSQNLVLMVDYNNVQIDGFLPEVKDLAPLAEKLRAFRWRVIETDGHDFKQIDGAFAETKERAGKPTAILFRTVMMKGCPSFENDPAWHGRPPTDDEARQMLRELGFDDDLDAARASMGNREFVPAVPLEMLL